MLHINMFKCCKNSRIRLWKVRSFSCGELNFVAASVWNFLSPGLAHKAD